MDTSKSVQQSSEQYGHPYGPHCHLLRSWEDFQALVTNAPGMRHKSFNSYLCATDMPITEKILVGVSQLTKPTIHKFEQTHWLCVGFVAIPIMLLDKKKVLINNNETFIHVILFRDPETKMTYYQKAVLCGYEPSSFRPNDSTVKDSFNTTNSFRQRNSAFQAFGANRSIGTAFYIYDHFDNDVQQLIVSTLNYHLQGNSSDVEKRDLENSFNNLKMYFHTMSNQMPKIPEKAREVVNNLQYSPGELISHSEYYSHKNFLTNLWSSAVFTLAVVNGTHIERNASKPKISIFEELRHGHSIGIHTSLPHLEGQTCLENVLKMSELCSVWNQTILNFIKDKFKRVMHVREVSDGHHHVTVEVEKAKIKIEKLVATIHHCNLMTFDGISLDYGPDVKEMAMKIVLCLESEFDARF